MERERGNAGRPLLSRFARRPLPKGEETLVHRLSGAAHLCVPLSNTVLPPAAVEAAAREGRFPLLGDHRAILARGAVPIERAMLNLGNARIRHDPRKVAGALVRLGEASRQAIGHRA